MKIRNLSILLSALFLFNSCAGKGWNSEQAASLPSVRVGQPTKAKTAYQKPFKISESSQNTANNIAFATGFAGGLIGGAVGGLVIGGIMAADQKKFEGDCAAQISRIESTLDHRVENTFVAQLDRELKQQPFFKARLSNKSPHALFTEVKGYGLMRDGNDQPMRFHATVSCHSNLNGTNEEALLENVFSTGSSTTSATLDQFASDKALLNKAFREASSAAASHLGTHLKTQTEKVQ